MAEGMIVTIIDQGKKFRVVLNRGAYELHVRIPGEWKLVVRQKRVLLSPLLVRGTG